MGNRCTLRGNHGRTKCGLARLVDVLEHCSAGWMMEQPEQEQSQDASAACCRSIVQDRLLRAAVRLRDRGVVGVVQQHIDAAFGPV